jgi:septal ring factor EnvC (AmiA/AmiB activator)
MVDMNPATITLLQSILSIFSICIMGYIAVQNYKSKKISGAQNSQKLFDEFKNEINSNFIKVNLKHDQECAQLTAIQVAIATIQDQITKINERLALVEKEQKVQWQRHDENAHAIEKLDKEVDKLKERVIKLETGGK